MTASIVEIWRYPVCSIGGERLKVATVSAAGVEGDRTHLLVDLTTGEVACPESKARWHPALHLSAERRGGALFISSPEWEAMPAGQALDAALTAFMGFACGIRAKGDRLHLPDGTDVVLTARYTESPLHVLTTGSMARLNGTVPEAVLDARRFRPNLVVVSDATDDDWLGAAWRCGEAAGSVTEKTKRCGMTMIAQPGLPEQPDILRAIVRHQTRCMGVYASVGAAGTISTSDVFAVG